MSSSDQGPSRAVEKPTAAPVRLSRGESPLLQSVPDAVGNKLRTLLDGTSTDNRAVLVALATHVSSSPVSGVMFANACYASNSCGKESWSFLLETMLRHSAGEDGGGHDEHNHRAHHSDQSTDAARYLIQTILNPPFLPLPSDDAGGEVVQQKEARQNVCSKAADDRGPIVVRSLVRSQLMLEYASRISRSFFGSGTCDAAVVAQCFGTLISVLRQPGAGQPENEALIKALSNFASVAAQHSRIRLRQQGLGILMFSLELLPTVHLASLWPRIEDFLVLHPEHLADAADFIKKFGDASRRHHFTSRVVALSRSSTAAQLHTQRCRL